MKKIVITVGLTVLLYIVLVGGGSLVGVNKYYNIKRITTADKVIWVKQDRSAWVYIKTSGDIMYTRGVSASSLSIFLSSSHKTVVAGGTSTSLTATVSDDGTFVTYSDGSFAMLDKNDVVVLYKSAKGKILFNWKSFDLHCWEELDKPFWKVDFLSPEASSSEGGL